MAVHFYNQETDFLPKGRTKINQWVRETIHNARQQTILR